MKRKNLINKYIKKENYTKKYFNELILFDEISSLGMVFIAGGALMDVFLYDEITSDVDLFCDSPETHQNILDFYNDNGGITIDIDNEAVTQIHWNGVRIDISKKYYALPDDFILDCDFIIVNIALYKNVFYYHNSFFAHLDQGIIGINNIHRDFGLFRRLEKYNKKGFKLSDADIVKIMNHFSTKSKRDVSFI